MLERIGELGIDIDVIAPDHGPIWRKDLDKALGWYGKWAAQEPTRKAVVVFDTMWHSTGANGQGDRRGVDGERREDVVMSLNPTTVATSWPSSLDAGALVVGSPTLNNGVFPTVADVLTYIKGLKPRNLFGAAFGSYGWSGEGQGM